MTRALLVALLAPALAHAGAPAEMPQCNLYSEAVCQLAVDAPAKKLRIHYSNYTFCELKIMGSAPEIGILTGMDELSGQLVVEVHDSSNNQVYRQQPILDDDVIRYGVGPNELYIADVVVKTRSGETLKHLMERTIGAHPQPNAFMVGVPVRCAQ
jgi:hypothetical protein